MCKWQRRFHCASDTACEMCLHRERASGRPTFSARYHILSHASIRRSLSAKRAPGLFQHRLQLPTVLHGRELTATADRLAGKDGIWHSRATRELAQQLLNWSVARLTAIIQLYQRVLNSSGIERILPVRGVGSVGLAEHQQAAVSMRLNLVCDELPLRLEAHAAEVGRHVLRHAPALRFSEWHY